MKLASRMGTSGENTGKVRHMVLDPSNVGVSVSLLSKIAAFGHYQLSQVVTANSSDQGSSTKCREVDIKFQMQRSSKLRVESHCLTSQCLDQRSLTLEQYLKMWLRSSTIPGQ